MKQSKELKIAIQAAQKAEKILLKYFNKPIKKTIKKNDTVDYVTEVDLMVEKEIIKIIKANFPNHDILAEEGKQINKKSDYRWIIDPLDGTTNYLHGLPLFATCIALEYKGEIILGVINLPTEKSLYYAQKGMGSYKNNVKISVSSTNYIKNSFMVFTFDKKVKPRLNTVKLINNIINDFQSAIATQSSGVSFALLSEGKFDGSFDYGDYWDFAAGIIIAKEAGAIVTDWHGNDYLENSGYILAANPKLHTELLKKI